MARIYPITSSTVTATVSGTVAAAHTNLQSNVTYMFSSTTDCWIRQGTSKTITCVAQANMVDTDFITITINGVAVVYEFDKAGNGVTAGRVQVNISTDTTAATVAARLATAIGANQSALTVTNPGAGVLTVDLPESTGLTITENVGDAGFTIGTGIMQATAGTGSMFVPTSMAGVLLNGKRGGQLGVIQAAAGGTSSTTQCLVD